MKILLIDNYDSFTYNLYHYISKFNKNVDVIRNDKINGEAILKKKYDKLVISPGPGNPNQAGNCLKIVKEVYTKVPILGVCLGHQIIGQAFGGKNIAISENWTTVLTVNLGNHESAYLKMTLNGNWTNHSGIMFLGEYFIANSNALYNEPGMIIRQVENTAGPSSSAGNTDTIQSKLVSSGDDIEVQVRIIDADDGGAESATAHLNFHIMGEFDTIT